MKQRMKKLLAMGLTAVMLTSLMPTAFASTPVLPEDTITDPVIDLSELDMKLDEKITIELRYESFRYYVYKWNDHLNIMVREERLDYMPGYSIYKGSMDDCIERHYYTGTLTFTGQAPGSVGIYVNSHRNFDHNDNKNDLPYDGTYNIIFKDVTLVGGGIPGDDGPYFTYDMAGSPFHIEDAEVNLELQGKNYLSPLDELNDHGASYPAIYIDDGRDDPSCLTIDECSTGSLEARGGFYSPAIGSNTHSGSIIINGGTVEAYGGYTAPGIGIGSKSSGGRSMEAITINGGNVTAYGGNGAPGIGCGERGISMDITITGGTVKAKGGDNAPGIGYGMYADVNTPSILITGGSITAEAGPFNMYADNLHDMFDIEGKPHAIGYTPSNDSRFYRDKLSVIVRPQIEEIFFLVDNETNEKTVITSETEIRDMDIQSMTLQQAKIEICSCQEYTDVDTNQWYHEAVDFVLGQGIMNGVKADRFDPAGQVTRSQVAQTLYNLAGQPLIVSENPFSDVAEDAWYAKAVAWAAENGLTEGKSADRFAPNDPVTREQLVTFICRYADWKGLELPSKEVDLSQYQDAGDISGWAKDFVLRALEAGIINGKSEDTLAPQGTATRAQIAQIFMNLLAE